jgi:hypothetical protein
MCHFRHLAYKGTEAHGGIYYIDTERIFRQTLQKGSLSMDDKNKPDFFSTWEYRLIRAFLLVSIIMTLMKWLVSEIFSLFRY